MSLLTGRYALMLFSAVGAVVFFTILVLIVKKYLRYKGQAKALKGKLPKFKSKEKAKVLTNLYKDVSNKIIKLSKNESLPSFLCVYEGNSEQMTQYISGFINSDNAETIILNETQVVIIEGKLTLFLISMHGLQDLNEKPFNSMLTKLYNKGSIQLPIVLLILTSLERPESQFTLFQKMLAQIQLFSLYSYEIHLCINFDENNELMRNYFEIFKYDNNLLLLDSLSEDETKEFIYKEFALIRDKISSQLITTEGKSLEIYDALKVASSIEKGIIAASNLLSDLSKSTYVHRPQNIVVNLGVHSENYHTSFFEYGSQSRKTRLKIIHIAIPSIIIISAAATTVFAYNLYQKQNLSDYISQVQPFKSIEINTSGVGEKIYDQWANLYNKQLWLNFLYAKTNFTELNKQYAQFLIKRVFLPQMYNEESQNAKAIYLSMMAALGSNSIADQLRKNIPLLALMTGLSKFQLKIIYQYGHFNIDNLTFSKGSFSDPKNVINTKAFSPKIFNDFVQHNNLHVTNKQLRKFINQSEISHQEICLLQNTIPMMMVGSFSLKGNILKFLSEVSQNLPQSSMYCNSSSILIDLQKLIPNEKLQPIYSFAQAVDILFNYNIEIDKFFNQNKLPNLNKNNWKKILLGAQLNSILVNILERNKNVLELLDQDAYYQYTFKTVFTRDVAKLSLVYSKNVLLNLVKPLLSKYKTITELLTKYNIDYSALDAIEKGALLDYAQDYVNALNHVLKNALPTEVNTNNLHMFLIDITSNNTPFSNMLDYIHKNTTFDTEDDIPSQLKYIPESFSVLNKFITSKEYEEYKQILLSISNNLYDQNYENYARIYNQLNIQGKDSLAAKLTGLLNTFGYQNDRAYKLFKVPQKIIKTSLSVYLINSLKQKWDIDITPKVTIAKSQFPLNLNAQSTMGSMTLNDMFGQHGAVYNQMHSLLKVFVRFDSTSRTWVVNKLLSKTQKHMLNPYLQEINYFYQLQNLLWDTNGKSKSIDMFVQPMPFAQVSLDGVNKMMLSFLQLGNKDRVLGLDTADQTNLSVNYNWQLQPTVSIGWLSESNVSHQKTYQGEWALFKMLADANCTKNWICTWKINSDNTKVAPYLVSFKFKSSILKLI